MIGNFQQAGVTNEYKKQATTSPDNQQESDWERRHREWLERQRRDGRPHPQARQQSTSRVDIVKPARMDARGTMYDTAGNRVDHQGNTFDRVTGRQLNYPARSQAIRPPTIQRPGGVGISYFEPSSHRYNPYA